MRLLLIVGAMLLPVAACSLITSLDGLAGDIGADADASLRDADAGGVDAGKVEAGDVSAPDAASSYEAVVIADKPVAYFRLGESAPTTAVDATGNGHDGEYLAGTVVGVPGAIAGEPNTAADVSRGGVKGPTEIDFAGNDAFSLEIWFRITGQVSSFLHLFNKDTEPSGGAATREQWGVFVHETHGLVFERYVAGASRSVGTMLPQGGGAHHVVVTYDGGVLALYVDGKGEGSVADSRAQQAKAVPLYIGTKGPGFGRFPGIIDEVAIYDRALSAADVARHHEAGGVL